MTQSTLPNEQSSGQPPVPVSSTSSLDSMSANFSGSSHHDDPSYNEKPVVANPLAPISESPATAPNIPVQANSTTPDPLLTYLPNPLKPAAVSPRVPAPIPIPKSKISHVRIMPSGHAQKPPVETPSAAANNANNNTVAEFLYQLTKMLTDNNKEVIEWSNGKFRNSR